MAGRLALLDGARTAARARRSGPACWPPDGDLVVFADADMATPPDQLPAARGGPRRRPTSRSAAGSSRTAPTCARASRGIRRLLGKAFHVARLGLGDRAGPGHPVRLQGLHAGRPPTTCSPASGSRASSSTSSSSTSPAGAATGSRSCPIHWADRRGSRMQPAARPRRCGSPGTCSGSRSSTARVGRRRRRPDRLPRRPAGQRRRCVAAALPVVAIVVFVGGDRRRSWPRRRRRWLRLPGLRRGRRRLLAGRPVYDPTLDGRRGVRDLLLPAAVRCSLVLPVRALLTPDAAVWAWTAVLLVAFVAGRRGPAGPSTTSAGGSSCWPGSSWPFLYAVKLGQVGPLLFLLLRARLALAGRDRPARGRRPPSARWSSSSRRCCSSGPA